MRAAYKYLFGLSLFLLFAESFVSGDAEERSAMALTARQAANLAAQLANEKCKLHFNRSPFKPEHYNAILRDNRWHWGLLDPAGIDGYSAQISFDLSGGNPQVEVYFSSDTVRRSPPKSP